jgi:hypothetical protein
MRHFLWDWTDICTVLLLRQHIAWLLREQHRSKLTNFSRNMRASLSSWWETKLDLGKHQPGNTHLMCWTPCLPGTGDWDTHGPFTLSAHKSHRAFLLWPLTAKLTQGRRAENGLFLNHRQMKYSIFRPSSGVPAPSYIHAQMPLLFPFSFCTVSGCPLRKRVGLGPGPHNPSARIRERKVAGVCKRWHECLGWFLVIRPLKVKALTQDIGWIFLENF